VQRGGINPWWLPMKRSMAVPEGEYDRPGKLTRLLQPHTRRAKRKRIVTMPSVGCWGGFAGQVKSRKGGPRPVLTRKNRPLAKKKVVPPRLPPTPAMRGVEGGWKMKSQLQISRRKRNIGGGEDLPSALWNAVKTVPLLPNCRKSGILKGPISISP